MRWLSSIGSSYLFLVFALVAFGCSRVLDDDDDRGFQRALFEPPGSGEPFLESPQVIAGYAETCALLTDGSVKCWGWNNYGTLGVGNTRTVGDDSGEMGEALEAIDLGGRARQIDMFGSHVCALLEGGSVKCWGRGSYGSLGRGSSDSFGDDPGETGDALALVDLGTGLLALQIGAGNNHSCALLDGGSLKCWGRLGNTDFIGNNPGEMGDALALVDLGTNRTVEEFDVGYNRTCAILDGGDLKCWGRGDFGALGYGSVTTVGDDSDEMGDNLDPVDLGTNRRAVSVAGGFFHTCAILDDGDLKCWGFGDYGQLGQGNRDSLGDGSGEMGDALAVIDLGSDRSAIQITAGAYHTCALLDNYNVKCWGEGRNGALGQGNRDNIGDDPGEMGDALAPIDLGTRRTAKSIFAGHHHTCAVLDNDSIKCWGYGGNGRLGQGDTETIGDDLGEMGDALAPIPLT